MLAIVYLIISAIFGMTLVNLAVPDVRRLFVACAPSQKAIAFIPNTLFTVPAGILVGITVTGFFNYFCILGLSYFLTGTSICKRIGMIITFAVLLWLTLSNLVLINRRRLRKIENNEVSPIDPYKYNFGDTFFYGIVIALVTAVTTFLMLYTYRLTGGELIAGFSTFSDLSPHTAMVSSFSTGFNFPTQYMHFSGDGIQYHFLFYFFAGILNYGGLTIDAALNVASIITMVSALVLLGVLAMLLSGKKLAFVFVPILVFFRSSWNVFDNLINLTNEKGSILNAIAAVAQNDSWYKVTPYDDWGIWAINIYPNQRHLMLGVGLIVMMVILFLPFMRRMCISCIRSGSFWGVIKAFAFSKSSWLPRSGDSLSPYMILMLSMITVAVMPYFHGSALIAMLLILFGMALFSECRLLHLIVAVVAVGSSYVQTMAFSGGADNIVSFIFKPGFVVENLTASGIALYILIVTGLTLVLAALTGLIYFIADIAGKKPVYRTLLFLCILLPMAFGFTFQVTMEMLANHKFIQITILFADVFVAILLANLFAIPFKIRKKSEEDEQIVLLPPDPHAQAEIAALGALPEVKNLADEKLDLPEEILDLPEEIDLPEEVEDLDDSESDEEPKEVENTDSEESEEKNEESDESEEAEDTEEASDEPEIPEEETTGVRPGNEIIPAEMAKDITVSETIEESEDSDSNGESAEEEPEEKTETEDDSKESEESETSEEESEEKSEEPEEEKAAAIETKPKKSKREISLGAFVALQLIAAIVGIILLVPLTATGLSEWCTYYNLNQSHYAIKANSSMVNWIVENTSPSDVFLTPMWSFNEFYLAGRPAYYGWPYYAWSAGHDTETRAKNYAWLISGCGENLDEFLRYCKERGIKYLIADPDYDTETYEFDAKFNWDFFAKNLTQVASFNESGAKIYKIY